MEGETRVSDKEVALGLFKLFDKDGSGKLLLYTHHSVMRNKRSEF